MGRTVSEIVSSRIGSTITDSQTWNIMYNAKQYSSVGDGVTDDSAALSTLINTTINGAQATIIFPRGTYRIGTALTVPSNVTLYIPQGAKFTVDTGIVLTINGHIEAGIYQIFTGSGSILGTAKVDQVYPQWFGCDDTGVTDVVNGWNKAIALLAAMLGGVLYCRTGTYLFNSKPDSLKQGIIVKGEGVSNTQLKKNYVETTATSAFMEFDGLNSGGCLEQLSLFNNATGGAGISLIAVGTSSPDFCSFDHIYVTGSAEWHHAFYVDGTGRTGGTEGVRDLKVTNSDFFQASVSIMTLKGFNNVAIDNIGLFGTGTAQNFDIVSSVIASNYLHANLTFCPVVNLATTGTVNHVMIQCPLMTNFNNGSGANNVVVIGKVGTKQHNWTNGSYFDPLSGSTTFGGLTNFGGGDFYSEKKSSSGNSIAGYAGLHGSTSVLNTLTYTFTTGGSSKMFSLYVGGGQGGLFHADNASATITIISNPSSLFENSSTPTAGKIGVFKSAASHVISIKNNTGSTVIISLFSNGNSVSSLTDPA